ncbi:MAG: thioredoxin fold domain-containing protein [Phreatobacter sp.]
MKRAWRQFVLASLLGLGIGLGFAGPGATGLAAAELVMFERSGCPWCARWDREVAPNYGATDEGKLAPLRRVNLDNGQPRDMALTLPVRFTPTFVLIDQGREVGRITGYMDEGMFWGLLAKMIQDLQNATGRAPGAASLGRPG